MERAQRYRKYLKSKGQLTKSGKLKTEQPAPRHKASIQNVFVRGIYTLKFKGTIVYVGMSTTNCMNRINTHWNDNKKIFDSFEIAYYPKLSDKQILQLEKSLIKQYKPVFNVVHNK